MTGADIPWVEPRSKRTSNDLDYFHDTEERVARAFADDRQLLEAKGYGVDVVLEQPGFVRAIVRGIARGPGADAPATKVEWVHDSAFRFLPTVRSPQAGFVLHPIELHAAMVARTTG